MIKEIVKKLVVLFICLVFISCPVQGQEVLYTVKIDNAEDLERLAVSELGDVNADKIPDFIVSATHNDNTAYHPGSVWVVSGKDGSIVYNLNSNLDGDGFASGLGGRTVCNIGDVDADRIPDFIVGAYADDNNGSNSGSAQVFSGVDGSTIYTLNGDAANDWFGWAVSGMGDVDFDDVPDFIVVAIGYFKAGYVRVFSGRDGFILYSLMSDSPWDSTSIGDLFGHSPNGIGDINLDGASDFVVGARFDSQIRKNSGSVRVLSGKDGSELYRVNGKSVHEQFGQIANGIGDVNADGIPDFMACGYASNFVGVFSGLDGSELYTVKANSSRRVILFSMSPLGDVNRDGTPDFLLGSPYDFNDPMNGVRTGSARVFSGKNGAELYKVSGDSNGDEFGWSVSGIGDVNSDGVPDFVAGTNGRYVRVFSGASKQAVRGWMQAHP